MALFCGIVLLVAVVSQEVKKGRSAGGVSGGILAAALGVIEVASGEWNKSDNESNIGLI